MPSMFPQLERQFEARAQAAGNRPSPNKRRAKTFALGVGVAGVASGVAYASGLWQPSLGGDRVAVAGAPADDVVHTIAALARPQTDADRSDASQFALTFPASQQAVRTDFVRQIGTTSDGRSLVLVPTTDHIDGQTDTTDELCLWIADPDSNSSGNRQCSTAAELREGDLFLATSAADKNLTQQRNAYVDAYLKQHPEGGTVTLPKSLQATSEQFSITGVAPNDAAIAQIGDQGPRVPVTNNVFTATVDTVPQHVTFFTDASSSTPLQ